LKVRFADFQTITRSHKLAEPTSATQPLSQVACQLLTTRLPRHHPPVRLLGMGVSDIDHTRQTQGLLFDQQEHELQERLDQASDSIHDRFGSAALRRASALEHGVQHRAQPRPEDDNH
jgi:DNA polymerase-4